MQTLISLLCDLIHYSMNYFLVNEFRIQLIIFWSMISVFSEVLFCFVNELNFQ